MLQTKHLDFVVSNKKVFPPSWYGNQNCLDELNEDLKGGNPRSFQQLEEEEIFFKEII